MIEKVYIVPKKGLLVRNPETMKLIPESGASVPIKGSKYSSYWKRQFRDGSIEIKENAQKKLSTKEKSK